MKALSEILADSNGGSIDYGGKNVMLSYKFPINIGDKIKIELLKESEICLQGIAVSIDKQKGYVEVNGETLIAPVFWTNTMPQTFNINCFPQANPGQINIWNIWQNSIYKNTDAWIGNAGLYVEHLKDNELIFYCSNGIGEVNFNNLVFKVSIIRKS